MDHSHELYIRIDNMVRLACDHCEYGCDHTRIGWRFAVRWYYSGKTTLAYCREFGGPSECPGVLRSRLTDAQINEEMTQAGYPTNTPSTPPSDDG